MEEVIYSFNRDGDEQEYISGGLRQRQMLQARNSPTIDSFLGAGARETMAANFPFYYAGLLAWVIKRVINLNGWAVHYKLGYREARPYFIPVETALGKSEDCVASGQFLLEKDSVRIVVTINGCSVQAEGLSAQKDELEKFIGVVKETITNDNFYRGGKLIFIGQPKFLDVGKRTWDQVVLDLDIKKDIKSNTVDFLRRAKSLEAMGVPARRGVLLGGSPGTGKTVICKALMSSAKGITCLISNAYLLNRDEYVTDLYEMAKDLKPSIVFIEDIDLIGQSRSEFGWGHASPLNSLLEVLDGLEEQNGIVTVATTNSIETLDEALSKRPSRFDRVINLPCPDYGQRQELISNLCRKTHLEIRIQDYISQRTRNFTPAQIQEVVYGLAIEFGPRFCRNHVGLLPITEANVDWIINRINRNHSSRIGFGIQNRERNAQIN